MDLKQVTKSQYLAALAMLQQAIEKCPDAVWVDEQEQNQFWHTAYHALFYTHLYLQPTEADFVPWYKHNEKARSLVIEADSDAGTAVDEKPYTKDEVLEYLAFCQHQVEAVVDTLNFADESGFYWLPFTKLELQFYNIRHLMQHTGELYERLWARSKIELSWVGQKPA